MKHYQIEITEVSSFELGRRPESKVITSKANHSRLVKETKTRVKSKISNRIGLY